MTRKRVGYIAGRRVRIRIKVSKVRFFKSPYYPFFAAYQVFFLVTVHTIMELVPIIIFQAENIAHFFAYQLKLIFFRQPVFVKGILPGFDLF